MEKLVSSWNNVQTVPEKHVVGAYATEVKKLAATILELICEGLGLEFGYFGGKLSEIPSMLVNHYPPCPDPSLTFGVSEHCDPNLITILQQESDVLGLQVLRNGEWIGVEPISKAFVVNMGYLHVNHKCSNNKLRSVEHRAVTNSEKARTSFAMFFIPNGDSIVEPAKALADSRNPAIFKSFQYKEFITHFINRTGGIDVALEPFKLQA
ncbi:hypothetical protein OIU84_006855 [Salix udensis]|uniref:Fe2OG dioxygenase domain-containing protein n=1 Tax=Salix udensis TaxID=889485 RepID=A0AAD6P2A8_9ROSI|nr:hypothetical protein OIU84_006855 [Salix udensis]